MHDLQSAFRWVDMAEEDLIWAEANLREDVFRGACFAAQQAAEKAFKAYLLSQGKIFPKIHDLKELSNQCSKLDSEFKQFKEGCEKLSPYYLSTRYPDIAEFADHTKGMAREATDSAKKIVEFVKSRLNP